jgi:hypothetical protein
MKKMNLQARIDALKAKPGLMDLPAMFDKTYGFLWEADQCVGLGPEETEESRKADFEKQNGTRTDFIKEKIQQYREQHRGNHD